MDSRTGNVYHNPVTRERAAVLVSAAESDGELVRAELWVPPGARVAAPHVHPGQAEEFTVLEGRLGVRRGSWVGTLVPGEGASVAPGTVHDWWVHGDRPARVLVEVRPALRFEEAIMTAWGLAAAGRTDAAGMPGLLQRAVMVDEWDDTIRFARPPRWAQRALARTLGPVARRAGLRGSCPELEERILVGRLGRPVTLTGSDPATVDAAR